MEGTARPAGPGQRPRRRCPWAGRGLAGLRDDAPSHAQRHKRHQCGGYRRARRARAGFETTHQSASATGHHWVERPDTQAAVPVGGAEPGRASHSDTSAAGVEGPEGQAAGPVGGGRAWPGFETTHPATHSDTSDAGVEGAGGSGGHGRASRSTTPSRRLACGDLAGGRARRHPEHQRHHKQDHQPSSPPPTGTPSSPAPARTHAHAHAPTHHPGITKPPGPNGAGRQWR